MSLFGYLLDYEPAAVRRLDADTIGLRHVGDSWQNGLLTALRFAQHNADDFGADTYRFNIR